MWESRFHNDLHIEFRLLFSLTSVESQDLTLKGPRVLVDCLKLNYLGIFESTLVIPTEFNE
jgi:hypothetical protein